jgi:hypothetical protein
MIDYFPLCVTLLGLSFEVTPYVLFLCLQHPLCPHLVLGVPLVNTSFNGATGRVRKSFITP